MDYPIKGHCLCGAVKFEATAGPISTVNCHCTDCRRITGAVYGTVLYFEGDDVQISGALSGFEHTSDRGTRLTKQFCTNCGSQLFALTSAYPTWIGIRAGCIEETADIKPLRNVFVDSKIHSTPLDGALPAIARMP
jgi:hypothetical protein